MRGSMTSQAWCLMTQSGILHLGESKGAAKQNAIADLRSQGDSVTSSAIAQRIGVHGNSTMHQYASTWVQMANFARDELGIKNIENLTGLHVLEYLDFKAEIGVGRDHLNTEMAALNKMEQALNKWSEKRDLGKTYDLHVAVETFREDTARRIPPNDMVRAYTNASALVSAVPQGTAENLAVRILAESGCRIAEGTKIAESQLRGIAIDRHTGKTIGQFGFHGKGGKANMGNLTPKTYTDLEHHVREHGQFQVTQQHVREALSAAAQVSGQGYEGHGAHGLRWNFAYSRMAELQQHKMSRDEALAQVSHEMSHNRADITEHYLRR
jgi:hypothetical protein